MAIFLGGRGMKRVSLATGQIGRNSVRSPQYRGTCSYAPRSPSTVLSDAPFS